MKKQLKQLKQLQMGQMRRVRRIHMVGIGGVGMSGIAELLANLGYEVSGSDIRDSASVVRLRDLKVTVDIGHKAGHTNGSDVVVYSSAISLDNSEILRARELNIPVIPRSEMLASLMRFKTGIAIAGTHGKTTTTSLTATIFSEAGRDPTYVIGGQMRATNSNTGLGSGDYLIAEADESDASFLYLNPVISVVTCIDRDHMEQYQEDHQVLLSTFEQFIGNLPFYGLAILAADDPLVRELIPRVHRSVRTYGFGEGCDYRAVDVVREGMRSRFTIVRPNPNDADLQVELAIPGRHNILNALAATAVATEEGIEDDAICRTLKQFGGVERRFQVLLSKLDAMDIVHVDDYGHHPTELRVVLETAREIWPDKRVVLLFQPHRYSRTKSLFDEFIVELSKVDALLLLDVYGASEEPLDGAGSYDLKEKITASSKTPVRLTNEQNLRSDLAEVLESGDVLLTMGAGNVGTLSRRIAVDGL